MGRRLNHRTEDLTEAHTARADAPAMVAARRRGPKDVARRQDLQDMTAQVDVPVLVVAQWPEHRGAAQWRDLQDVVAGADDRVMVVVRWPEHQVVAASSASVLTRKVNDHFRTRRPYFSVWIVTKTES